MDDATESAAQHICLKGAIGAALFSLVAFFVFALPDHPDALGWAAFFRLPLEWPLIGLLVLAAPRGALRQSVIALSGLVVFSTLVLKAADMGVQTAFQRPFNPYLDVKMLRDGWNVLSGTIGSSAAVCALAGAAILLIAVFLLTLKSMAWMASVRAAPRRAFLLSFSSLFALGVAMYPAMPRHVSFDTPAYLANRVTSVTQSIADMTAFEQELAAGRGPLRGEGLFEGVRGKDVIVVFVESYGRSAVEDERYSGITQPRLHAVQQALEAAGFHAASGWLTSPTVGGLSWLAHGTLLSGLWTDSQARYDRLMVSHQPSLNRLFSQAGWRSVAVMPAITMAWPEASYFGYDTVLAASDLQYRGKPFNWITMPDQYTLSALSSLVLQPAHADGKKVMAEIALISSHAPWTPVPRLVDWSRVGDGTIFNSQADSGEPPALVWADPANVRRHYISTIDYTLSALGEFLVREGGDKVYVIVGDHQPAAIITGQGASRAVPIHIVTDDQRLLSKFRSAGFTDGMIPDAASPERPMNALKTLLIDAFEKP